MSTLKEAALRISCWAAEQSQRAMTINVARQWRQEHRMGSIEFGKIANMTVFDCDFFHDDLEKVAQANIIATIADAQLNLASGVVVTNAKFVPLPEGEAEVAASFFGPDGRHDCDYIYYYNNIRDNVAKRIAAYKEGR